MSKILITGGAGFIGYHLASALAGDANNAITVVDNLSRGKKDRDFKRLLEKNNVTLIDGDLTERRTYDQLDTNYEYIYHLAAIVGVKNVVQHPDKVLYVNAVSTLNLFEYAKRVKGLKKIVLSSTSEVYAGTLKHFGIPIPTDERVVLALDNIADKRTTYALSKILSEAAALMYGVQYGIPVLILRYHNIYGPRMGLDHVIPEMFVKINKSATVNVPSPNHTRAFCYIDDAVKFTIKAAANKSKGAELLHIGNSYEEINIKELVSKMAGIMHKRVLIKERPDTAGSPSRRCPDISKAIRITGYKPRVSLEEGIRKTYEWYRDKI